ncbi:type I 3-dehydroquinate dehydratase [Candidatus Micrarchaeota archaeon]|nr:type I 3-dehydroquinate dehydratase [Candidatus Micrarchaeota archaeon]
MILVPIVARTVTEAKRQLASAKKAGADGVEIRLDAFEHVTSDDVLEMVKNSRLPVLATCRTKNEGGFTRKTSDERKKLLLAAIQAKAAMVDVELSSPPAFRNAVKAACRKNKCRLVVSKHDFDRTPEPKTLNQWVKEALKAGDIAKIVCLAHHTVDLLRLLDLVKHGNGNVVAFAMGEQNKQSRVLSLLYGAPFGFAALHRESAPGQIPLKQMRLALEATKEWVA